MFSRSYFRRQLNSLQRRADALKRRLKPVL